MSLSPRSPTATLVDLLQDRSAHAPCVSFDFLIDGDAAKQTITFAGLDVRARAIAASLQARGLAGARVLLLFRPGLDFLAAFFGCLYAGAVAVPVYPPTAPRGLPRVRAIRDDAAATFALTTAAVHERLAGPDADRAHLDGSPCLFSDGVADEAAAAWRRPAIDAETTALLQYTSGSTGDPKGTVLVHANLLHNLALIRRSFDITPETRGVSWLPPYHDMGLIGVLLGAIEGHVSLTLLSPMAFLQRPVRWLRAISETGATCSAAPNFAYDLCVERVTPAERDALDLGRWRHALVGAEPVRAATMARFADYFAPAGFRRSAFFPTYGLAEATLLVSGLRSDADERPPHVLRLERDALARHEVALADEAPHDEGEHRHCPVVSVGGVPDEIDVRIVDPFTRIACAPARVGEIWVRGPSVARGYFGKARESEETFGAELATDAAKPEPRPRFLRTGDLGFLRGGELFVTGRLKDILIVRGRNHYPNDLERTAGASHPALRLGHAAAFAVDDALGARVVIVQEVVRTAVRNFDALEALLAVRQAVAETHELGVATVCFVRPESVPKTSSGKVRRLACREMFVRGDFDALTVGGRYAA